MRALLARAALRPWYGARSLLLAGCILAAAPRYAEEIPPWWGMRGVPDPPPPSLPFIDPFGQYMHRDWPGKLAGEQALLDRRNAEEAALDARPRNLQDDPYGGWTEGPPREATGWFRTEKVDGKWWFITPTGYRFFSIGVDCVGTWERTFVEGRNDWFAWLPHADDPVFGKIYGHAEGAHSMAEPIGGQGRTFSFYAANLVRKYGEDWPALWRRNAYRRFDAWGFNTLGNWTQGDVLEHSPMPYVASTALQGVLQIEGATGYWARMMDVYDPAFESIADEAVRALTAAHRDRPMCIGYFVDNELAWEGVVQGVLNSPATQPARSALLAQLQSRYPAIDALNTAWGTGFADWQHLAPPAAWNEAAQRDADDFLHAFARRYFGTIAAAVRRHAPHQLYLGARFAAAPPPAVRACAAFADVVSFNLYQPLLRDADFAGLAPHDTPAIIGEFHFGATDRGLFHPGLGKTTTQEERAGAYTAYLQSALDNPAVIGVHWFQYIDEPVTGRWFDGENYNIGLVDVTDTPYPELIGAATRINRGGCARRAAGPSTQENTAAR